MKVNQYVWILLLTFNIVMYGMEGSSSSIVNHQATQQLIHNCVAIGNTKELKKVIKEAIRSCSSDDDLYNLACILATFVTTIEHSLSQSQSQTSDNYYYFDNSGINEDTAGTICCCFIIILIGALIADYLQSPPSSPVLEILQSGLEMIFSRYHENNYDTEDLQRNLRGRRSQALNSLLEEVSSKQKLD